MSDYLQGTPNQQMDMTNPNVLQQQTNHYTQEWQRQERVAREEFIAARSKEEVKFNNWVNCVRQFPDDAKSKLPYDINILNLRTLIPEWYKEEQDEAAVLQQVNYVNSLIESTNKIIEEAGYRLERTLQEYDQLEQQTRAKEGTA